MSLLFFLYAYVVPDSESLEKALLIVISVFFCVTIVLFFIIMMYRSIKIADTKYIENLKNSYDDLFMSSAFASKEELKINIEKTNILNKKNLNKKKHAHIIVNQLLLLYNSFTGESKENLKELYFKSGFLEYSEKKVKSRKWEIQAQGIREVAQMKDERVINFLKNLSLSKNQLVKENAQLSLVKICGFNGLNFLSDVNTPISDWQQLNLLEALKEHGSSNLPDFTSWLSSSEKTVILFAIRLINHYKQIEGSHKLLNFLNYRDKKIKLDVIRTLSNLNKTEALPYFISIYKNELIEVKTEIIRAFALLSDGKNLDILLDWLTYTDNVQIQIECIKVIISLNAIDLLKNTTIKDPELLAQIETVLKNH